MKISFVIPAHNEAEHIGSCIEAILAELSRTGRGAEIIVVNNASADETAKIARAYTGVVVVDEPRKGLVWARQAGFKKSTGELISNIDADTMITPGWLDMVEKEFSKDPRLACLSGPFMYYDLSLRLRFFVRIYYWIAFFIYLLGRLVLGTGTMVQGGNFVCRREALDAIGGFDTRIDFYGEDTDIARRISRVGEVKWTFKLPAMSSGRRLASEGVVRTGARYVANFFWVTFFGKPLSASSTDVRLKKTESLEK